MKTVRLDPDLEAKVEQAASREGLTVSAFIRRALEKECAHTDSRLASHRLAPYIGAVCSEHPTDASRIKEIYRQGVLKKAAKWKER
jgi:hypothetical protein